MSFGWRLLFSMVLVFPCFGAEPSLADEREWLTNEEMGKQIFERTVVLPAPAIPKILKAIETLSEDQRERVQNFKARLQTNATAVTMKDIAELSNIEEKDLSWYYDLLATNQDSVVRFFGLIPKVILLKDESAAKALYDLGHPASPNKDQLLLDNSLHGIGIDPREDNAKSILEFLGGMRDRTQPPIGSVPKNFAVPTLDGRAIKLSDFQGKPVLLHFWATDCGPCVAEFDNLAKGVLEYKTSHPELVVIGISLDDDLKELNHFLFKHDMQWINVCDRRGWGGQAAKAFHISGIPSDVLIDREGKIHAYSRTQLNRLLNPTK
jgi:peroxiredoxin